MTQVKAFLAGFLSTLVFHQGALAILYAAGVTARKPWILAATPPFGLPSVISLAFWGGVWGIALWWMIRGTFGARHWILAVVLGAILPTLVALLVVFPLKGMRLGGGWKPELLVGALLLNGAWGAGFAFFMQLLWRGHGR
jgi:hypothetical protein